MDKRFHDAASEPLRFDVQVDSLGCWLSEEEQTQLYLMGFSGDILSEAARQILAVGSTPTVEQLIDVLLSEEFQSRVIPVEESPRSLQLVRSISSGLSNTLPTGALAHVVGEVSPTSHIPSFSLERLLSYSSNYGHRPRECPICFDVLRDEDTYQHGCSHAYHTRCFSEHVRQKMLQAIDVITCPECPRVVGIDEARRQVSSLTVDNYEQGLRNRCVLLDPNRIFCPSPNCNSVLRRPLIEKIATFIGASIVLALFLASGSAFGMAFADAFVFEETLQACFVSTCVAVAAFAVGLIRYTQPLIPRSWGWPVTCRSCRTCICYRCKERWHPGFPCDSDARLEMWAASHNAQQCPRCRNWIEFLSGCDHMKCRSCGHHFNWQSPVAFSSDTSASGLRHCIDTCLVGLFFLSGSILATEVILLKPIDPVVLVWCTVAFLVGPLLLTSPFFARWRVLSSLISPFVGVGLAFTSMRASVAVGQEWASSGVSVLLFIAVGFAAIANEGGVAASIVLAISQCILICAGAGIAILADMHNDWQWLFMIIAFPWLYVVMIVSFLGNMFLLTLGMGLPMMVGFALAFLALGVNAFFKSFVVRVVNASVLYLCFGVMSCGYLLFKFGCLPKNSRLPVPEVVFLIALLWVGIATREFVVDAGWTKPNFIQASQAFFGLSAGLSASSSKLLRVVFGIIGAAVALILGWQRENHEVLIVERYTACTIAVAAISYQGGIFLGRYGNSRFVDALLRG